MTSALAWGEKVIYVEGRTDKAFVQRLIGRTFELDQIGPIEVERKGGIGNIITGVPLEISGARFKTSEFHAVGVVVDADDDPVGTWERVAEAFDTGFTGDDATVIPSFPSASGTVISLNDRLRLGLWMMPDNASPGELEDFVATMIPVDDPVWPQSKRYVDGILPQHRLFSDRKETRAKVLSWIATREQPGLFGQAIARGDLNTNAPLCQAFIAWLNRLFADTDSAPTTSTP